MFVLPRGTIMMFLRLGLSLLCLGLLSSCSGTYHAYASMFKVALSPNKDVVLPYDFFAQAKYDYLYVKHGDEPQVALALAYIEQDQLKWVSADNNMLVTRYGRIVRTLGLNNDLLHLTNKASDPLHRPLSISAQSNYLRLADWQQGEYGYQIRSTFSVQQGESLQFFGQTLPVIKVTEHMQYENTSNFIRFDSSWQNVFWLEAKSGRVVKASQQLQPGAERFELVFVSEVLRQLKAAGIAVPAEAL